jgi:hypothetical protein
LLEHFETSKEEEDHVEIMRSFVIKLTSDFNFRKERNEFFKWLQMEGLPNVEKVKEKKVKPKREYLSEVIIQEEDEEDVEIDFESFEDLDKVYEDKVEPLKVILCPYCKTPSEFCEFNKDWKNCQEWMQTNCPEILKEILESKEKDKAKKKKIQTLDNSKKDNSKKKNSQKKK